MQFVASDLAAKNNYLVQCGELHTHCGVVKGYKLPGAYWERIHVNEDAPYPETSVLEPFLKAENKNGWACSVVCWTGGDGSEAVSGTRE